SGMSDSVLPARGPATPTTAVQFSGNLDARTGPAGQGSFAVPVYDASGNKHNLALTFTREAAPGHWTLHTVVDGAESGSGTPVNFDGNGQPVDVPASIPISVNGQAVGLSLSSLTQVASPSN